MNKNNDYKKIKKIFNDKDRKKAIYDSYRKDEDFKFFKKHIEILSKK